jgi:predicted metal-dependent hydrolase
MSLIRKSFQKLYPEKSLPFKTKLRYSKAFKGYNANIKLYNNILEARLSKKWYTISREIQLGLIQSLLIRLFKEKKNTTNIDLYNNFIKNVHIAIPKTNSHPLLEESFNRVNEKYFLDLIEQTNLEFNNSVNKLGSYEYGLDTITISKYLKEMPQEMLDYVMYHEMLHKKHKFKNIGIKTNHHTKEFKEEERKFENSHQIEKQLRYLVTKTKKKGIFHLLKTKMFL